MFLSPRFYVLFVVQKCIPNRSAFIFCYSLTLRICTEYSMHIDMGGGMAQNAMVIIYGLFGHYRGGGYFINGGPQRITRSMMPVIEAAGGRCLANAPVQEIIFENEHAVGVVIKAKKGNKIKEFRARYGVVCTAGFVNLYTKYVD